MQACIDGFMRTYAARNNRQEQQRVLTWDGRPMCDICGKIGHVRQNCYHRLQQNPTYYQPPTIPNNGNIQENEPRIAAFEQVLPSQKQPTVNDQNKPNEQGGRV